MDYKNLAMHTKPEKTYGRVTWVLVLLTPIFIAAALLLLVPDLTTTQQILIILLGLVILLVVQLYKVYREYQAHINN